MSEKILDDPPVIEWRDVRVTYAPRAGADEPIVAVDGVTLAVQAGDTVGVAGESGCGKSTLMAALLRLLPRSTRVEGDVRLGGEDITTMSWGRLRAVRWGEAAIVFQGAMHALNPVRRVGQQIAEPLELHLSEAYPNDAARRRRVEALLEQVDLRGEVADSYPHELSGGQKQRVMIAMALACDPDVIVADEPTTALDVLVQAQVLELLSDLVAERGLTLVMISHDLAVLAAVCERIVVMQDGRIVEEGPARQILTTPEHPHTQQLAAAFPVIGDPASRWVRPRTDGPRADAGFEPLIEARDLVVDFRARGRRVRAVDHVSLALRPDEIVALVGQSGSGKTTLARTLLGLQAPSAGQILYDGRPVPRRGAERRAHRRAVQFVLQDPSASLNPKHSVYEAVAEGPRVHRLADEAQRVERALEQAELRPAAAYLKAIPSELSGGQRQRVVIAGALALDPTYLVADEPVASLDASVRGEVLGLLRRLGDDLGLGALVITHDLGLAWNIADRVVVMHEGRIVEDGPTEQVLSEPSHEYTRSLLAVVPSALGLGGRR